MFSKAKSLVKNHWKKVVYAGVGIKAVSYGLQYAANRVLEYQEKQSREILLRMKKKELFDRNDANAVSSFISLLPTLRGTIERILDSDTLTKLLKTNTVDKLKTWDELKCIAFARVLASVYGGIILNLLIRIQLHVIGGYAVQESLEKANINDDRPRNRRTIITPEVQREYLNLADYFVRDGMERMCLYLLLQVTTVIKPLPLKQRVAVQDLEQTMWHIVEDIHQSIGSINSFSSLTQYVFPPEILRRYNNFDSSPAAYGAEEPMDLMEQLMSETFDLLQSSDAVSLLSSLETHGISNFLDRLMDIIPDISMAQSISLNESTSSASGKANTSVDNNNSDSAIMSAQDDSFNANLSTQVVEDIRVPLARVIPPMNSYAPSNLNDSDPWVLSISRADTLRTFAANVFESFSQPVPVPL